MDKLDNKLRQLSEAVLNNEITMREAEILFREIIFDTRSSYKKNRESRNILYFKVTKNEYTRYKWGIIVYFNKNKDGVRVHESEIIKDNGETVVFGLDEYYTEDLKRYGTKRIKIKDLNR